MHVVIIPTAGPPGDKVITLSAPQMLAAILVSQQLLRKCSMDAYPIIVEMRLQAALCLAQGYLASKWREQDSNPNKPEQEPVL